MCVYCNLADWANKHVPWPQPEPQIPATIPNLPWTPWSPYPSTPSGAPYPITQPLPTSVPSQPVAQPWSREQYEDFVDILAKIKDMEDRLGGCPCEDESKMDFLKEIKARLDAMDAKLDENLNERGQEATTTGLPATDPECCGEGCCDHERRTSLPAPTGSHPITSE